MRRTSKTESRRHRLSRLASYRPMVEVLEDRLPPGDIILGHGLVGSWLGQSIAVLGADSRTAINRDAETPFGHDSLAQIGTFVIPQANRSSFAAFVATRFFTPQEERTQGTADSAQAQNQGAQENRLAHRHGAGLDEDLLDRLIPNDFEALLSLPFSSPGSHKAGTAGVADIDSRGSSTVEAAPIVGGGGLASAPGGLAENPPTGPFGGHNVGSTAFLISTAGEGMHTHVHLSIVIDGREQVIPAGIGIGPEGGHPMDRIHTHDASGLLHMESPESASSGCRNSSTSGVRRSRTRKS
jgi:hypothetical protein